MARNNFCRKNKVLALLALRVQKDMLTGTKVQVLTQKGAALLGYGDGMHESDAQPLLCELKLCSAN